MKRFCDDFIIILKNALQRNFHPLYKVVHRIYWQIRYLGTQLLGTRVEERFWARRSLQEIQRNRIQLRGHEHPHRDFLINQLELLYPFSHVLEIGCGFGQNLYHIARRFPDIKISGIDINPNCIAEARIWFQEEGITNASFFVGKADDL